jgi:hypothetical protein
MNSRPLGFTLIFIAGLAACGVPKTVTPTLLPVPPLDSRWERTEADRIALPLTAAGRKDIEDALTYGLNRQNQIDNVATDPNAKASYGPLLDLLAQTASLSDLSTPAYKKWYPGKLVMQIVDARDAVTPRGHAPVALNDGRYWWVFYRNTQDQLNGVMVVKVAALEVLIEKAR